MSLQSSLRSPKKPLRLDDEVRFLRSWIEKPLHMGAVMPSGKPLARAMAQCVDIAIPGPVIELGPGTGAITNALVERGVDQSRLVLLEFNPGFCADGCLLLFLLPGVTFVPHSPRATNIALLRSYFKKY